MKICIVGNSQAAALKNAVDTAREAGGSLARHRFDTYAIPGGWGPHLEHRNGRIFPLKNARRLLTDIDGAAEGGLDLSSYDGVLFSAAGQPALRIALQDHILNRVADAAYCDRPTANRRLVSHALFDELVRADLRTRDSLLAVGLLREAFEGPIFVQSCPLPSRGILSREDCDLGALYGDRLGAFLSAYYRIQYDVMAAYCREVGTVLLPLPLEGVLETGFTPNEYSHQEPWHMNDAYGKLILDSVAEHYAALTEGGARRAVAAK